MSKNVSFGRLFESLSVVGILCCSLTLVFGSLYSMGSRGGGKTSNIRKQHNNEASDHSEGIENYPFKKVQEKIQPDQIAGMRVKNNSLILLSFEKTFNSEQIKADENLFDMKFFKRFPNLLSVDLSKLDLTDENLENLQTFMPQNLQMLIVDSCKFSKDGCSLLADIIHKYHTLKSIRIRIYDSSAEDSEKIVSALGKLQNLDSLGVGLGSLSNESVEAMGELIESSKETLKDISLSWERTGSGDEHAYRKISEALQEAKNVRNLELAFMNISEEDTEIIFEALKNSQKLTSLNVFIGNLGSHSKVKMFENAEAFAESLKNMKDLEKLDISNMKLSKESMHVIATALGKLKKLKFLNISGNAVDAECAGLLADALKETSLETLVANDCGMTAKTFGALSKFFTSSFLTCLYLGNNSLKEGVKSIPLANMKDLQFLDLSNCDLSFDEVIAISKEINSNNLQAISFRENSGIEATDRAEKQAKRDQLEEIKLKSGCRTAYFGL